MEFAKVDCQIEYSNDEAVDVNKSDSILDEKLQTGVRATKQLPPTIDADRLTTRNLTVQETKDLEKERRQDDENRSKNRGAFLKNGD